MIKDHYEWARAEERALARYLRPEDLPEEFQLPKYINRLDLLQAEGPRGVALQLYSQICKQNIQYDLSPFNPRAGVTQLIRKPTTILNERRGTCLDLAMLFAGMCLANDLLPLLVVVEEHAFVGLSLTRTRHDGKKPPKALAWDKGKLTNLDVLQALADQEYVFIECTGATQSKSLSATFPEGRGREENGRMSFERACEAGREQLCQHSRLTNETGTLNQRPFLYALDIHDLQVNHDFEPVKDNAALLASVHPKRISIKIKVVLGVTITAVILSLSIVGVGLYYQPSSRVTLTPPPTLQVTLTPFPNKDLAILVGTTLSAGFDMGVDTSGGLDDWVTNTTGAICMAYPAGQSWGTVFVTVGRPAPQGQRLSRDLSMFTTLSVELRGEQGGEVISVGIKDRQDVDDGSEVKIPVALTSEWRTYNFPLSQFTNADLSMVYIPVEFIFEPGVNPETVCFRNIWYLQSRALIPRNMHYD